MQDSLQSSQEHDSQVENILDISKASIESTKEADKIDESITQSCETSNHENKNGSVTSTEEANNSSSSWAGLFVATSPTTASPPTTTTSQQQSSKLPNNKKANSSPNANTSNSSNNNSTTKPAGIQSEDQVASNLGGEHLV